MKTIKILISFLILFCNLYSKDNQILDSSITSGWEKVNNYWEQKMKIESITYIKSNSTNNIIYTNCYNGTIRKWNFNDGSFIKKFDKKYIDIDINPDREEIIKSGGLIDYQIKYNEIIDLKNDSVNKQLLLSIFKFENQPLSIYFNLPYFNDKNTKSISLNSSTYRVNGSNDDLVSGSIEIYDLNDISNSSFIMGCPNSFSYNSSNKFIAYSTYTKHKFYKNQGQIFKVYNILLDSNKIETPFLKYNKSKLDNYLIDNLQFSPNGNLIYGIVNYQPYIWKTSDMLPHYTFKNIYRNLTFTSDSKRLLVFNNNVLQILNFEGDILKDSIFTKEEYSNRVICKIDNTNKFIIGGDDGVLRLFDEELMNKDLISFFKLDTNSYQINQEIKFIDKSEGDIKTWTWDFGDSNTSTEQNPVHSYTKAGLYDVKLIVSDGTQYDTLIKKNYIQIFNNTSVEYTKEEIPPFSPNPVKDKLFIKTTEFNNTDKIQIFDLNGRKLIETELKDIIDVTSLSKGIYIHKIDNKEWKFVKE